MKLPLVSPSYPGDVYDLLPSKIIGIGVNYREHAKEMQKELPEEPIVFLKPPSALLAPLGTISAPMEYGRVDYEGELAVIMARQARNLEERDALAHVLGYTCAIDVSVRELQKKDGQWARAKGFDTFCPVGPRIVGDIDPADLKLVTRQNGLTRQSSRTSDLIFSVPKLIAFLSQVMTLEAGDMILTGTPQGVGPMAAGDIIEVDIEQIGCLKVSVRPR
ncbi:MAG: fumarylacetoacetate hydrolase family protein [Myxococcales bacterium]|nr:fumarylacetoacetate hydrolase family protein [Myxococcales bacterium]